MGRTERLVRLAEDIAAVIPKIDVTVSHENYGGRVGRIRGTATG